MTPVTLRLSASRPAALTASVGVLDAVVPGTRDLSGVILPVGEVGLTSIGPIEVHPDAVLEVPEDLSTVALVDEHHPDHPVPVGYATAVRKVDGVGFRASFHLPENPDTSLVPDEVWPPNLALAAARARIKTGFSVELSGLVFDAAGLLTYAVLSAVAHVTVPAFNSARHDGLAASRKETRTMRLTDTERARLRVLLAIALDQRTEDEATELADLVARATADEVAEAMAPEAPADEAPADEAPAPQRAAASRQPARVPVRHGAAPGAAAPRRGEPRHSLPDLYASMARVLSGRSRPDLEAALSDITSTANIWTAQDEYAGQLWSGLTYARQYVQNSTPGPLNSYKGTGWRWVVKPEVDDYAGDKAAVPSNAPTTEDTEWTAARLAGAHDIDRKFWDFGDEEFIAAYFEAMRESYAMQSDDKARAFQLASATAIAGAETSLFRAAAVAAQAVQTATNGQTPDWFYISATDQLGLLDITSADIPAYLDVFGVTPDKFKAVPGVAAGTVVAGVKQATKFRELSETPIRVEAINVANGGVDGGVFGYYATELILPGGIQSKTFA